MLSALARQSCEFVHSAWLRGSVKARSTRGGTSVASTCPTFGWDLLAAREALAKASRLCEHRERRILVHRECRSAVVWLVLWLRTTCRTHCTEALHREALHRLAIVRA